MKAVILQPFYLPWAGYFGMIDATDTFVFPMMFSSLSNLGNVGIK